MAKKRKKKQKCKYWKKQTNKQNKQNKKTTTRKKNVSVTHPRIKMFRETILEK